MSYGSMISIHKKMILYNIDKKTVSAVNADKSLNTVTDLFFFFLKNPKILKFPGEGVS